MKNLPIVILLCLFLTSCERSVFVWTFKDVVGLSILGLCALYVLWMIAVHYFQKLIKKK